MYATRRPRCVADPVRGELVHAWVVLRQHQTATEAELRAFCRERIAPYKVPSRIQFRTELFNVTNSVNFAGPQTSITSSAFGTISLTQVNNPRAIQFGLRVVF